MTNKTNNLVQLADLFPQEGHILLTGQGRQFLERIGVDAIRNVVTSVLVGENVRALTEPLTRQRLVQISGALLVMFLNGWRTVDDFGNELPQMAARQLENRGRHSRTETWLAQWVLVLTGKAVQNLLRGKTASMTEYVVDFQDAVERAVQQCRADFGGLQMTLGFMQDASGQQVRLEWKDIALLTTAIGSQTLTIRGSDKSMFGKLFERLVLGSVLTVLGFEHVEKAHNTKTSGVFWLSDSAASRESDATLLLRPGKIVRFDIGFIGPGNSEISKDKLSRYERQLEREGKNLTSRTIVIVDRLPQTGKTMSVANAVGADIIQMSMQYWPRELAHRLAIQTGSNYEMQAISDRDMKSYIGTKMMDVNLFDFVSSSVTKTT